jgi:DNA-binding transcriptional regulator YiaG
MTWEIESLRADIKKLKISEDATSKLLLLNDQTIKGWEERANILVQ